MRVRFLEADEVRIRFEAACNRLGEGEARRAFSMALNKEGRKSFTLLRRSLGRADDQRQYEPILYGWKQGTDHFWCGANDQGGVWFVDKPRLNDLHPTMKPVELIEWAITNSLKSRVEGCSLMQSRWMSFVEAVTNIVVGYGLAVLT